MLTLIISFNKAGQFFRKKRKKMEFAPCWVEKPLQSMEVQEKKEGKKIKAYRKFV